MIRIRYSTPIYLDISGSLGDLQVVRQDILDLLASDRDSLTVEADMVFDPVPYSCAIPRLLVAKGHGPTRIVVGNETEVQVSGSVDNLARFASFFDFTPDAKVGEHTHYEHWEGNPYIASDSVPLVVSVE